MKKNFNVIQIKGIKGLLMVIGAACCLAAGFIYFPGWVLMHVWNFLSHYSAQMPIIGVVQGILLWGIIAVSYFTFRKEKLIVCMRSNECLDEEELKQVFADMRKQAENDTLIQTMLKARETELKIKNLKDVNIPKINTIEEKDKVESK